MSDKVFDQLVQVVQLIALDCQTQIQSFPEFVHVPDEIALVLADACLLIDSQVSLTSQETDFIAKAKQLDTYFANLSKDKFTVEALCTSPDWDKAREFAQAMIASLGLERKKPDLSWLKFMKG
jgi:hypothetical protein